MMTIKGIYPEGDKSEELYWQLRFNSIGRNGSLSLVLVDRDGTQVQRVLTITGEGTLIRNEIHKKYTDLFTRDVEGKIEIED